MVGILARGAGGSGATGSAGAGVWAAARSRASRAAFESADSGLSCAYATFAVAHATSIRATPSAATSLSAIRLRMIPPPGLDDQ